MEILKLELNRKSKNKFISFIEYLVDSEKRRIYVASDKKVSYEQMLKEIE